MILHAVLRDLCGKSVFYQQHLTAEDAESAEDCVNHAHMQFTVPPHDAQAYMMIFGFFTWMITPPTPPS
ncbi:hypothetical protein BH11GEM1_BH11GEM1_32680 [soil metagenome]